MSDLGKDNPELTSLFRWLVLAGLLLWIAMAVASSAPTPPSESQEAATFAAINPDAATSPEADPLVVSTKTEEEKTITDKPTYGVVYCPNPPSSLRKPVTVNYACFQRGTVSEINKIEQSCNPGFEYTVRENKGNITITPKALPGVPIEGCTPNPPPARQCVTDSMKAIPSTSNDSCKARYCVGGTCTDVDTSAEEPLLSAENLKEGRVNLLLNATTDDERNALVAQMGLSSTEQNTVLQAFTEQMPGRISELEGKVKTNESAMARLQTIINGCSLYSYSAECADAKAEINQLEAENTRLNAQAQSLKNAQVRLSPGTSCMSAACVDREIAAREAALAGPGADGPAPTLTPPPTTFPPPQNQQGQQGQQSGGFGQFIQGFLKSLFGGGKEGGEAPPPGNQVPRSAGTCEPELLCSSTTLYQRNTQCVDTPVQQCQYGCSSRSECAASQNGQCANSPARPNVSGCLDGTWQAKYTNGCITDWQCISTIRPTAELSCQPLVADAGMTLSITYGCSAGTSAGSGFSTNGAISGATTTVLATPPEGTNTATFGLTCTNQGQTATDSCSVQVAKPAIVLVANPKSVESGEKATIGWVTSGMEECVVSSVQQSDFTDKYADKKNVNGVAETSPITEPTDVLLSCTTVGGNVREVTATILVI